MAVKPVFMITCDRCEAKGWVTAFLDIPTIGGVDEKGEPIYISSPVDEALDAGRWMAEMDLARRGWRVARKDWNDLCPDCFKLWQEIGIEDYVLEPTSEKEYEKTGHRMEFRYKGNEEAE